jgi:hypothetical protein
MKYRCTVPGWLVALIVAAPFFFSSPATALMLSSYGIRLSGKAGSTLAASIDLTNEKDKALEFDILIQDLSKQPARSRAWLETDRGPIRLGPHESITLDFNVLLPEDATGQFLARISFTEREKDKPSSPVSFLTRVSIHLAATVEGTVIFKGQIC